MNDGKKEKGKTRSLSEQKIELIEDVSQEIIEDIKKVPSKKAGLVVLKGPITGEIFFIEEIISIGRDYESNIFLDDITVSRNHASIEKIGSNYIFKDLGSLNGSYVNGTLSDNINLKSGDRIQIGKYIFLFFIQK